MSDDPIKSDPMPSDRFAQSAAHAVALMDEGFTCAEATVIAVGTHLWGEVDPLLVKASTAFHGGVGGSHDEMCGALSGGLLISGALYGRAASSVDKSTCSRLGRECRRLFLERWGTTTCGKLRACGYGSAGIWPCSTLVAEAVTLLLDLLEAEAAAQ